MIATKSVITIFGFLLLLSKSSSHRSTVLFAFSPQVLSRVENGCKAIVPIFGVKTPWDMKKTPGFLSFSFVSKKGRNLLALAVSGQGVGKKDRGQRKGKIAGSNPVFLSCEFLQW